KGIGAIEPEEGLAILEKLMSESVTQVGVIPIDWSEFPPISPFFADFSGESRTKSPETSEILKIPPEEQRDYLTTYVNSQIAQVLGMSPSEIDTQTGFFDLGMDSLTAVEFRNLLQNHLNIRLPSTVAFDYPNVKTLVDYLTAEVLKVTPVSEEKTENLADLSEEEIADLLTQELLGIEQEKQR
ncbi:acyl carrier protein, partial [Gloeocapsa sp. PCC 73106]|uniref:acyl carrier protein n=1 Tax=Gloeocapsa sp. PCC 73106 TaxID=102232 RepID=UPI0002AC18E1